MHVYVIAWNNYSDMRWIVLSSLRSMSCVPFHDYRWSWVRAISHVTDEVMKVNASTFGIAQAFLFLTLFLIDKTCVLHEYIEF